VDEVTSTGRDVSGARLRGMPSRVRASGQEERPLTESYCAGPGQRVMSGRRVAEEDGTARGTVCQISHRQALIAHSRPLLSNRSKSCSGRDGFHLTRRVGALPGFGGRWGAVTTRRWSVAHACVPSSIQCARVARCFEAFPSWSQTRSELVHSSLAPETRSSPK
jgi:hypothetical protein